MPSNEVRVSPIENADQSSNFDLSKFELEDWVGELKSTGIRGLNNQFIQFANINIKKDNLMFMLKERCNQITKTF